MNTKTWFVELPLHGIVQVEVEADSEEEAIEAALSLELDYTKLLTGTEPNGADLEELSTHRYLVQGNIAHVNCIEASAEPADGEYDDEDDA